MRLFDLEKKAPKREERGSESEDYGENRRVSPVGYDLVNILVPTAPRKIYGS